MKSLPLLRSWLAGLASAMLLFIAQPASAAVEITFYSREFGSQFPHGFVTLVGTPDRGGDRIDVNYGFTATHVTPAILFGSVRGKLDSAGDEYIGNSDAHFAVTLSDPEYDSVMATIERYRALRQPSYNLNRRNCVHFLADVAVAIGMTAATPRRLMRRPGAFTESLIRANRTWLAARPSARILREPGPERRRDGDGDEDSENADEPARPQAAGGRD
jgi:hypothetical protein